MAADKTPEVRILPTLWTGVATGSTWGVPSLHHPKHHLHPEPELEWHEFVDHPTTMKVLRQVGRNVELLSVTDNHEARGVGTLFSDGTGMITAGTNSSTRFEIDGDRMTGVRTIHYKDEASGEMRFGTMIVEYQAGA